MAFFVGDKVIVSTDPSRSEHGVIHDILRGNNSSTEVFEVKLVSGEVVWARTGQVFSVTPEENFTFEVDIPPEKNIVIVKMMADGEEIGRGHGHVIHHGAIGIAQAMSYACKRIWNELLEKEEGERF